MDLLDAAVSRLTAASARDEWLADLVKRRVLGVPLSPTLARVERVWRLGVLLLGHSGALYATGTTLRVSEPRHPNAQSVLAEDRRQLHSIALKSGFSHGETINLDAHDIRLDELTTDTRPVALVDGELRVEWSATSPTLTPLGAYLDERVGLLVDPPAGAGD